MAADVEIGAHLNLDTGDANTNIKGFKQQLREAQQEVVLLSEKFGATSKEAANAAKRAAELQDAIGDAKSLVDAFNPDTKFRAFGATLNTVVGGFSALQGVMGLVGAESEETQKAILKVQSALAISQGFAQVQEGVQTFKNLGAVIQSTTIFQKANAVATNLASGAMRLFGVQTAATSTAMNVLKGAIIATGIGALVVLLGVAAQAMGFFSDKTDDAADAQKNFDEKLKGVNDQLDRQLSSLDRDQKLAVARLKARGATETEIFNVEQDFRRKNVKALEDAAAKQVAIDGQVFSDKLEKIRDAHTEIELAEFQHQEKLRNQAIAAKKKADDDAETARKKKEQELIDDERRRLAVGLDRIDKIQIEIPKSTEQLQIENTLAATHKAFEQKQQVWTAESDARSAAYTTQKDQIKELEAAEENAYQQRKTRLQVTSELLGVAGSILGKQTAAGKAFAIAQATINTYLGATEVLRTPTTIPEPFGTIAKIANVAAILKTGFDSVKNIAKTNVPGGNGGGVPTGAIVSPPLTPERPQQQSTTLDQQSLNAINNATTRAYVLESDNADAKERITRLNRAAKLGG